MTKHSLAVRPARAALVLAAAFAAQVALAQESEQSAPAAPGEREGIEVIQVTATRRGSTDVQTTPVAVTAISEQLVGDLVPNDLGDIAGLVPNFSAGKPAGFNAAAFAIRGVGQTSIILYADAHVGVAIDDFVVPHIQTQAFDLFDIQQVEVLRGPQGTLFGKNTTGGMVNVRTKRPVLEELSIEYQQKIASFDRFEERFALNVPIGDTLAVRGAGAIINSDGFYEIGAAYGPVTALDPLHPALGTSGQGDGRRAGGDDLFTGRFKLLFEPSDAFNAMFTYEVIRDDSDSPPVANGTPPDLPDPNPATPENELGLTWNALGLTRDSGEQRKRAATTGRDDLLLEMSKGHRVDVDGYYLNLEIALGELTLHSVTGFRKQQSRLPSTYTGEVGPNSLFDATRDDDRETFQQELRLDGNYEIFGLGADFVAGFFYQDDDATFCVLQVLGFLDLLGLGSQFFGDPTFFDNNPQVLCNAQKASNWALFGDTTLNLTDKLAVSAGFRWTDEKKRWTGRNQVFIQALDGGFDPLFTWRELGRPLAAASFSRFPTGVVRDRESWGEPTGRVTLSYAFNEAVFSYLTYSHGFKSGAYNDQTGTSGNPIDPAQAAPTDPEKADSFEVGLKLDLLDRRVRLDLAGFWVKYSDAQRDLVAHFTNQFGAQFEETRFFNAAEVTAGGIEAEMTALLTDWLTVRGNLGWIESKYKRFEADTDFDGTPDIFLSGRDVNRSIPFQSALDLTLHHPVGTGEMRYTIGVDYEDEAPFVYSSIHRAYDGITDERTLLNASIAFSDDEGRYFVRVYGHNLTDEEYRVGELPVGNLWTMSYYGEPQTFGVEFGFKFRPE